MKTGKKIFSIIGIIIAGLVVAALAFVMIRMYKPVLSASREIEEVGTYAMDVSDELVNRDVKVIGLGEATHGNKEFQELKLDVLQDLVRDNGVSAICFEMDYAEGILVNDYICGRSDMTAQELFSHISFELYHTEEMLELIEWMRGYNAKSPDGQLEFYGYDMQNPEVAAYVIDTYVKEHNIPLSTDGLDAYLAGEFGFQDSQMEDVLEVLETYKEELSDDKYQDYENVDRILSCIDNMFVSKELAAISTDDLIAYGTYRDQAMKDNIIDISNKMGTPIMITGHNGHVGYAGSYVKTMGSYLKEALGDDYFVIGTDYFKTTDSMQSGRGRADHTFYSADPLAYQAKELGTYYLRFDDVKNDELLNAMVTDSMPTGTLGEFFSFLNYLQPGSIRCYTPVTNMYDGMIYIYKATPMERLEY